MKKKRKVCCCPLTNIDELNISNSMHHHKINWNPTKSIDILSLMSYSSNKRSELGGAIRVTI